jgi:hypothetical protein
MAGSEQSSSWRTSSITSNAMRRTDPATHEFVRRDRSLELAATPPVEVETVVATTGAHGQPIECSTMGTTFTFGPATI